jgi:hypothetical protein
LSEHRRLFELALDYEERYLDYTSDFLLEWDAVAADQALDELELSITHMERAIVELDDIASDLGADQTCIEQALSTISPLEPLELEATSAPFTPSPLALPTLTPVAQFEGSEEEFKAYLRGKYSAIAGQALQIESIFILDEGGEYPIRSVTIELTRDSALYVFAKQSEESAFAYGRALLHDTMAYFGGEECSAYVSDSYHTFSLEDYHFDEEWYYIGDYDVDDGWYVSKDYVKAHFMNGQESIEAWNWR